MVLERAFQEISVRGPEVSTTFAIGFSLLSAKLTWSFDTKKGIEII